MFGTRDFTQLKNRIHFKKEMFTIASFLSIIGPRHWYSVFYRKQTMWMTNTDDKERPPVKNSRKLKGESYIILRRFCR